MNIFLISQDGEAVDYLMINGCKAKLELKGFNEGEYAILESGIIIQEDTVFKSIDSSNTYIDIYDSTDTHIKRMYLIFNSECQQNKILYEEIKTAQIHSNSYNPYALGIIALLTVSLCTTLLKK